jgi:hypothetical protein
MFYTFFSACNFIRLEDSLIGAETCGSDWVFGNEELCLMDICWFLFECSVQISDRELT